MKFHAVTRRVLLAVDDQAINPEQVACGVGKIEILEGYLQGLKCFSLEFELVNDRLPDTFRLGGKAVRRPFYWCFFHSLSVVEYALGTDSREFGWQSVA